MHADTCMQRMHLTPACPVGRWTAVAEEQRVVKVSQKCTCMSCDWLLVMLRFCKVLYTHRGGSVDQCVTPGFDVMIAMLCISPTCTCWQHAALHHNTACLVRALVQLQVLVMWLRLACSLGDCCPLMCWRMC